MFLTYHWMTVMGKSLMLVDALSIVAAALIILFLVFVGIKQRTKK